MVDEVYVKQALEYHGGTVFGNAVNDPSKFATSMLRIMLKCLMGGPTFLFKMLPVNGMDAEFLFNQVQDTISLIREPDTTPVAIICDGNRMNQRFFKLFRTKPNKPWETVDGMFLLFDFVHLLKNIRNNWLTEVTGKTNTYIIFVEIYSELKNFKTGGIDFFVA